MSKYLIDFIIRAAMHGLSSLSLARSSHKIKIAVIPWKSYWEYPDYFNKSLHYRQYAYGHLY